MRRPIPGLLALTIAVASWGSPVMAAHKGWKAVADIGVVSLSGLSLGRTIADRDWTGSRQLAVTLGATAGATAGLKRAFPETRPDRSDDRSFPSGHTSTAFAAAGFLQRRYGWEMGAPATLAAGLVGLARVASKDHHVHDVVAGAALGEVSAYIFTTRRETDVRIVPWADSQGVGFAMAKRF